MRKRDIFSLLVACREVTYDKDGERHVYIDEEKIKNLNDLKKAITALPKDVQEKYRDTQARVEMFKGSYRKKYRTDLVPKSKAIFDPALLKIRRKENPIEVTTSGSMTIKEPPAEKPEQGE